MPGRRRHDPDRRLWLRDLALYFPALITFTALSLLICGYGLGPQVNHELQWTVMQKVHDPSLYPNDPVVELYCRAPTYFFYLLGKLGEPEQLTRTFWLLQILFQFGCIAAMMAGAWRLRNETPAAPLLAAFGICGMSEPLTGASPLNLTYVTHATAAAPVALAALACLIHGRWTAATLLCGGVCAIHPLRGLCVWCAMFGWAAGRIAGAETGQRLRMIRKLALGIAPGLIITLLALGPSALRTMSQPDAPFAWWKGWVVKNFSIHYDPFGVPWHVALRFYGTLALLLTLGADWFEKRRNIENAEGEIELDVLRSIRWMTAGLLTWIIIGAIGADVLKIGLLIQLQPARAGAFLIPLLTWALIYHWSLTRRSTEKDSYAKLLASIATAGLLLHVLYFAALRQQTGYLLFLLSSNYAVLCAGFIGLRWITPQDRMLFRPFPRFATAVLALVSATPALMLLWIAAQMHAPFDLLRIFDLLHYSPFFITMFVRGISFGACYTQYWFELIALAFALTAVAHARGFRKALAWISPPRPVHCAVAGMAMLLILSSTQIDFRRARGDSVFFVKADTRFDPAVQWIRQHTPKDAYFLVYHEDFDFFRTRTKRGALYERTDGYAVYLDPLYALRLLEITEALQRPGFDMWDTDEPWTLEPRQAMAACAKFGCDYLAAPPGYLNDRQPVYHDELVDLYHLSGIVRSDDKK
ncbi:hypothetical protein JXA32_06385 [Candidatus Sumerlaeota bacterium]|nr:hypothetical protein [Candidatus Sumerlaeota bacterium]